MVFIFFTIGLVLFFLIFWLLCLIFAQIFGAPTVHSSDKAIVDALKLAELKKDELLIDLGCGGARVLILAAEKFAAREVGVDRSPYCYLISKFNIWRFGQRKNIEVLFGGFNRTEEFLKKADVVYIYLLNSANRKIEKWLFESIGSKTRVVSLSFDFENHKPKKEIVTKTLGRDTKARLY